MHSCTNYLTGKPQPCRQGWGQWYHAWRVAAVVTIGLALVIPHAARAKTFHCNAGNVSCLIAATTEANANGKKNTITLDAGTYTLTAVDNITEGENGLPAITSSLIIKGEDAESTIIERDPAASPFRIFHVGAQGELTLRRTTVRGGLITAPADSEQFFDPGFGGGILSHGMLTIIDSTIAENTVDLFNGIGGGIFNDHILTVHHSIITQNFSGFFGDGVCGGIAASGLTTISESTISQNAAGFIGGGFCASGQEASIADSALTENFAVNGSGGILNTGILTITNTTIANNKGFIFGGGIDSRNSVTILNSTIVGNEGGIFNTTLFGSEVTLQNTILALNTSTSGSTDCAGPITSLGNNLIGEPTGCTITLLPSDHTGDPGLGDFTADGSPGNGHFPLLPTSQAIDAGHDAACPKWDQLGEKRHPPCDIGAIEFPHGKVGM